MTDVVRADWTMLSMLLQLAYFWAWFYPVRLSADPCLISRDMCACDKHLGMTLSSKTHYSAIVISITHFSTISESPHHQRTFRYNIQGFLLQWEHPLEVCQNSACGLVTGIPVITVDSSTWHTLFDHKGYIFVLRESSQPITVSMSADLRVTGMPGASHIEDISRSD
jgi:hypothetical protein